MRLIDADKCKIEGVSNEKTAYKLDKVKSDMKEYIETLMVDYQEKIHNRENESDLEIAKEKLKTAKEMYDIMISGYEKLKIKEDIKMEFTVGDEVRYLPTGEFCTVTEVDEINGIYFLISEDDNNTEYEATENEVG